MHEVADWNQTIELTPSTRPLILAVVVTYQPVEALLSQLLLALSPQVSGGIVINNGSALPLSDDAMSRAGFEVRHLHSNTGVATALNIGFQWAQAQGAEFVITFDQDSEPASNMVGLLLMPTGISVRQVNGLAQSDHSRLMPGPACRLPSSLP